MTPRIDFHIDAKLTALVGHVMSPGTNPTSFHPVVIGETTEVQTSPTIQDRPTMSEIMEPRDN